MGATRSLCQFVVDAAPGTLPPRLTELAKCYTLDTLGCGIYGSTKPWSRIITESVRPFAAMPNGRCTVIGAQWSAAPPAAALVNGSLCHAFELDDVHDESLLHPGAVVVPAALAVAEHEGSSGSQFLRAVVLGYEVNARVGLAVGPVAHMLRGFHPTGCSGVFGSATAAGLLLGLDVERLVHALGIAGSFASGVSEFCETGGMVKRVHAGRPAEGGILAAYLAHGGLTGPTSVLEGKYGYLKCFSDAPVPEELTTGLGERFMIDEITVKPYSCCSDLHAAIDATLEIKEKHAVDPAEVSRIIVESTTKVAEQNAGDGTASIMEAQYSVGFAVAATLLKEIRDPRTYAEETLADPALKRLQDKVEVSAHDEFDAIYARVLGGRVTVIMNDGTSFTASVKGARGSIHRPFTQQEVEDKFRRLCCGVLADGMPERLVDVVAGLDQAPSVDEVGRMLRGPFGGLDAGAGDRLRAVGAEA